MALSFLLVYWTPYWRRADMDIMMVYQAFLVNSGHAQDFFDHPGHLHVLLISAWFKLLHGIGFLDIITLADMPPASDVANFEQVWTAAVRAGRLLSLAIVSALIVAFAFLLRRLVTDWRVAALGTFMFAFSSGVMWHAHVLRTDMLAAGLEILGLLLLLSAARSSQSSWRPVVIGVAAMLCTLGVVNKVQALLPAVAWTVVVMFFGIRSNEHATLWRSPARAAVALATLAALALLAAIPVADLIHVGFSAKASSVFPLPPPPFGISGLYQALLAGWICGAVVIFALIWRVPFLETLATVFAVALGVAAGLLSLKLLYHPQSIIEVVNPLELMLFFASWADPQLAGKPFASTQLLQSLSLGFLDVLARLTFVLHTSTRATVFLQWVAIAGICLASARGQRRLAAQVAILVATAWGIDTVGSLRGLKLEYSVFGDPIIVVAAAWLLANLPELREHRLAFPLGVVLIAAHLVLSQIEPVKLAIGRPNPEAHCEWLPRYTKLIERFPFCPPQS